jgi:hypothetical protein
MLDRHDTATDTTTRSNGDSELRARIELVGEASDLLDLLEQHADESVFFWDHPDGQEALLGVGEAARIETSGPGRLEHAADLARALLDRVQVGGAPEGAPRPLILGGFAFRNEITGPEWAEFAPCRFVLRAPRPLVAHRHRADTNRPRQRGRERRPRIGHRGPC